ncbi:hypothetical protein [Aporhodopirellula aestuarii]|uniref:Secreted protein n=1 Tax=Aporhodopirellula aestuarii TaxID=2950107 RepID=A0ABT0U793_9BACT|nr:hypothetical protein [Aporhodopirellula aestuarii]MCM2372221.1 hypothetical protein [Aporhodopirellula aestuarii]
MQIRICSFLVLILSVVGFAGCADEKPARTYSASDIEQLLKEHPELNDAPPEEFRVKGESYD